MRYVDPFDMVGNTPTLLAAEDVASGARIHVKLEGLNPTGSVKDRACARMLGGAKENGSLHDGVTILDASSGNMASSIAFFGHLLGYPTKVVAGSKLTPDKRNFIEYFGASLELVGNFTIDGNEYCRELVARDGGDRYCFLDQLHNWDNPKAHYVGTGPEIVEQFPELTMVVGSLGSGGTMLGTAEYVKRVAPHVAVVAVEAASGSKIPGAGSFDDGDYVTPFIRKGREEGLFDVTARVSERDAIDEVVRLRSRGLFCGPQTGAVIHAAIRAACERGIAGDVVVISGDSGWKNMQKLLGH